MDHWAPNSGDAILQLEDNQTTADNVAKSILIGRVIADKVFAPPVVKDTLRRAWAIKGELEVKSIQPNTFLLSFQSQPERKRAINGIPWLLAGYHLILKEWPPNLALEELDLTTSVLWVQVHGLPLSQMTKDNAERIGSLFAGLVRADHTLEDTRGWNSYMRLLVRFDVDKPLIAGFNKRRDNGLQWVSLKYEKLPETCFWCGIIGHSERLCPNKDDQFFTEANERRSRPFGTHMKAESNIPVRRGRNQLNTDEFALPPAILSANPIETRPKETFEDQNADLTIQGNHRTGAEHRADHSDIHQAPQYMRADQSPDFQDNANHTKTPYPVPGMPTYHSYPQIQIPVQICKPPSPPPTTHYTSDKSLFPIPAEKPTYKRKKSSTPLNEKTNPTGKTPVNTQPATETLCNSGPGLPPPQPKSHPTHIVSSPTKPTPSYSLNTSKPKRLKAQARLPLRISAPSQNPMLPDLTISTKNVDSKTSPLSREMVLQISSVCTSSSDAPCTDNLETAVVAGLQPHDRQ